MTKREMFLLILCGALAMLLLGHLDYPKKKSMTRLVVVEWVPVEGCIVHWEADQSAWIKTDCHIVYRYPKRYAREEIKSE